MQPASFEQRGKIVIGVLMIAVLALTLIFLQQQFDQGDHTRAVELLMSKPPGAQWSIAEELDARAGTASPECQPKIVSSFAGTLEVRCTTGPEGTYRFAIDLVRKTVLPLDERTRSLIATVQAKMQPSVDGGPSPLAPGALDDAGLSPPPLDAGASP